MLFYAFLNNEKKKKRLSDKKISSMTFKLRKLIKILIDKYELKKEKINLRK